jgi:hypothetical protein
VEAMVFASTFIVRRNSYSGRDGVGAEALYAGPGQGLKEIARVVAMLGGLALYAGLLAFASG